MDAHRLASLQLTHVHYDGNSHLSLAMAFVTLSPILLQASYAALSVVTREFLIIEMWAGQLACEAFNWVLKRWIKQERPNTGLGNGYGFPSSHSQYMGYFAAFLIMHLAYKHKFMASGYWIYDSVRSVVFYGGILSWSLVVCFSRFYLGYHSPSQVMWGASLGAVFGVVTYTIGELIPTWYPNSFSANLRTFAISNPLSTWFRIKDGWSVWPDGGSEEEWQMWRARWQKSKAKTQ